VSGLAPSLLAAGLLSAAACGGGHAKADAGPCWPLPASPGGEVELGTGDISFEPLPAVLPLMANGSQSDPYIAVYARIRGIPPGNPEDFFDPSNPRTKVSATIPGAGLQLGQVCPSTIGYVPSPEPDAYDLLHALRLGIGTYPPGELDGAEADLVVEVVGSNGLYAKAEQTVMLSALVGTGSDAGVGTDGGAGDAGPLDAGPADAAPD
jgi:hypothetical protein